MTGESTADSNEQAVDFGKAKDPPTTIDTTLAFSQSFYSLAGGAAAENERCDTTLLDIHGRGSTFSRGDGSMDTRRIYRGLFEELSKNGFPATHCEPSFREGRDISAAENPFITLKRKTGPLIEVLEDIPAASDCDYKRL